MHFVLPGPRIGLGFLRAVSTFLRDSCKRFRIPGVCSWQSCVSQLVLVYVLVPLLCYTAVCVGVVIGRAAACWCWCALLASATSSLLHHCAPAPAAGVVLYDSCMIPAPCAVRWL